MPLLPRPRKSPLGALQSLRQPTTVTTTPTPLLSSLSSSSSSSSSRRPLTTTSRPLAATSSSSSTSHDPSHGHDDAHDHDHGHAAHSDFPEYDPPGGWLFGVPPGQKYQKEGWENIFIYGFLGSLVAAGIAMAYKPDTSIQTWALEEARRRLEREGILEDPTTMTADGDKIGDVSGK